MFDEGVYLMIFEDVCVLVDVGCVYFDVMMGDAFVIDVVGASV